MDKQELLLAISQMATSKNLTQEELMSAFNTPAVLGDTSSKAQLSLAEIMYYIGAGIVFLGIAILCEQNWLNFNTAVRVLVTLGSSVAAFVVAGLLSKYENLKKVSQAFFLLSGILAPLGAGVLLTEYGFDTNSNSLLTVVSLVLFSVYMSAFYFFRQTILAFFGIIFATAFFHYIVSMAIGNVLSPEDLQTVMQYRILAIGISYMLLGYYFTYSFLKPLQGFLYGFGSLLFLGSAMALGGWIPSQNMFWELIYPVLVFGIIFLSVYVKSKSFLVFGTLFLIGYILKITSEYFASGLGWPLALVVAGFGVMAVGYWAVKLNKKYFQNKIA